jgi:hypothetical protein
MRYIIQLAATTALMVVAVSEWNVRKIKKARACVQLSRIIAAASCTPARKFLASLS